MPTNKMGDHYANPAVGRMMEGGGKPRAEMSNYDKEAEYRKAGYMINKLEIEYAENGFVVKCYWEYPKKGKKMMAGDMPMGYMEPTTKVFEKLSDMTAFVKTAFNDYRHGYSAAYPKKKTAKRKSSTTSRTGGGRKQSNYPPKKKGNPHGRMHY